MTNSAFSSPLAIVAATPRPQGRPCRLHLDRAKPRPPLPGVKVSKSAHRLIKHNLKRMGIDIYTEWKGQTEEEKEAQITGFSIAYGHVGYLRESYHGAPYATQYLVAEAFDSPEGQAQIPASVLRRRLPKTIRLAKERLRVVYNRKGAVSDDDPAIRSFADFVALCERKEAETGEPVTVIASY